MGSSCFRVRVDGSGLEQISFGRKIAQDPVFSPNGKRVVFARLGKGLFVINVDGSGLRRLTPDGTDHAPALVT
jgi:Tol biopolymer transport system component